MTVLKCLPKVNKFCCCIKNLKCASFIIIFLGMITGIDTASVLCDPLCEELYTTKSPLNLPSNILRWILFACELGLIASLLAFLLGLFWFYSLQFLDNGIHNVPVVYKLFHQLFSKSYLQSLQITAVIAICCILIKFIVSITYCVVIIIQEQYTICPWYVSQAPTLIVFLIMWIHFILVINTHAETM